MRVSLKSDTTTFLLFQITEVRELVTPAHFEFFVTTQSSSSLTPFNDGDDILVSFVTNGDKGEPGIQGSMGPPGPPGPQGSQGPPVDGGGVIPYQPFSVTDSFNTSGIE